MSWVSILYYSPYLFQFFFLILYIYHNERLERLFNKIFYEDFFTFFGFATAILAYHFNISLSYYNNTLIIFYIIQTTIYQYYLSARFNKVESISLAFMLSFATSFYWEIPIHLMALFALSNPLNILINSLHFATLPFLSKFIKVRNEILFKRWLLIGLILNDILAMINIFFTDGYENYLNMASRIIAMIIIIFVVLKNIDKKDEIVKKVV